MQLDTALLHAGVRRDPAYGAVSVPVYPSATFQHPAPGESTGYDYSRSGTPTRAALEEALARAEGGARALASSSGMAAVTCALGLLGPGDHLIVTEGLYGRHRLLEQVLGLPHTYVDTADLEAVRAVRPETRAILVESLTNPTT